MRGDEFKVHSYNSVYQGPLGVSTSKTDDKRV